MTNAKFETELFFIQLNQSKWCLEEYIHLRHVVANDGNMNINVLEKMLILPAICIGAVWF